MIPPVPISYAQQPHQLSNRMRGILGVSPQENKICEMYKKQAEQRLKAEASDQLICLPNNYTQFQIKRSTKREFMNLPVLYPEAPLLAHTMIFTVSEIIRLKTDQKLLKDFKTKTERDMAEMENQI